MPNVNMKAGASRVPGSQMLAKGRIRFWFGAVLSLCAGTVNGAATISVVRERTMHMSGRVNDLLRDLVYDPPEGLLVATLVASFVVGAFLAGRWVPRQGLPLVLLKSAFLLFASAAIAARPTETMLSTQLLVGGLLALAGGIQNGATSQVSPGRTTHCTGDLTDMSLALAASNWAHAAFLFTKMAAFSVGGITGFLGVHYGHITLVLLACGLTVAGGALYLLYGSKLEDAAHRSVDLCG